MKAGTPAVSREAGAAADGASAEGLLEGAEPVLPISGVWEGCRSAGR